MFVADQVYDRFVDRFVARTEAMTLGATLDWGNDMGPLISAEQLDTVQAHVDDAVAKGARVLTGGRARPDLAPYFFEPTILEGVTPDMACFGDETFGPVVSVYRFHDEADAVARANDGEYGLNGSIYSQDGARARAIAREIKCGTVNINEGFGATFGSVDAPMGGMRQSGLGRRQGAEGIRRYTETQSVGTQRLVRIAPMLGMSDAAFAKVMTAGLRPDEEARPCRDARADYDVLVVGSGFGGSVAALRLTEKGYRVGVLEAGARFADEDFAADVVGPQEVPVPARARLLRHPAHRRAQGLPDPRPAPASAAGRWSTPTRSTSRCRPSTTTRRGATSPTGGPSWRRTTTRPSGCSASTTYPRTRRPTR